jgi:protein-S-isoprenylcysteine O-methyltransferase Ste14
MSLGINRNGWGELIRGPVGAVITGGILFGSAGTIDLWQGWLYTLLIAALGIGHTVYLAFTNPALLNARGKRSDMRLGDTVLLSVFGLAWAVGVPAVAGYELGRLGGGLPGWWAVPGTVLFVAGTALLIWSLSVNPFFDKTMRIRDDHRVISDGPYTWMRHPGYSSILLIALASPLVTGSVLAFIPSAVAMVAMVIRTAQEDGTLHRELPGYPEYAAKVRQRLIPRVW